MVAVSNVVDLTVEDGVAVITVDFPPVNALSVDVRVGLLKGMSQAIEDDGVSAIVLICAGRTFIVGADITEFGGEAVSPSHHEILAVMENSAKPLVAAIHGTALGGGLETALVCHYRVSVANARFGLPEVKIGLAPGSGGSQRLPRVVGVEKALKMVATGEQIGAEEALEYGLISEIVEDLRAGSIAFAKKIIEEGRPLVRIRDQNDKINAAKGKPEIFADFRKSIARKTRGFDAPEANIKCIEAAVNCENFDDGIKAEFELFYKLVIGDQSAAQRHVFFAERLAAKIPDIPKDTPEIDIRKVGIIGAGTMGGGISMNILNIGIPVTIVETKQEALDRGMAIIRRNYENTAKKGRISQQDVEDRMGLLTGTLKIEDLADCDLVIEAVFENMDIKKDIFSKLDNLVKDGAILASNTSGLDVNEIAAVTKRPESVIGLHFFSPANVMKLLEIVRGDKSSNEVIKTSMSFAKKIGKIAALVGVCPGFVGNRMLFPRQIQADKLVMDGALPHEVDKVLFDFGMPMGPYQMSDLAGLDLGWNAQTSKGETVYERLCEAGRFGQKNGKGFYDYDENRVPTPSKEVGQIIQELSEKMGRKRRKIDEEEILDRCLYLMINEGAKILSEGMAIRSSDIDVIWVYGYGWPSYRGGPMFYADSIGLDVVVSKMRKIREISGDAVWDPDPLLVRLAEEGKGFKDFVKAN